MTAINKPFIGDIGKKLPQTGKSEPISPVDQADAALFQRMFTGTNDVPASPPTPGINPVSATSGTSTTLGDRILNGLSSMSEHMRQKQDDLATSMRRAVNTGDPMEMARVVEKQNEFALETQLTNRLVTRAAQTIDQMSKQQ